MNLLSNPSTSCQQNKGQINIFLPSFYTKIMNTKFTNQSKNQFHFLFSNIGWQPKARSKRPRSLAITHTHTHTHPPNLPTSNLAVNAIGRTHLLYKLTISLQLFASINSTLQIHINKGKLFSFKMPNRTLSNKFVVGQQFKSKVHIR